MAELTKERLAKLRSSSDYRDLGVMETQELFTHIASLTQRCEEAEAERDRLAKVVNLPEPTESDKASGWRVRFLHLKTVLKECERDLACEDIEDVLLAHARLMKLYHAAAEQAKGEGK